ncbi:MAG: T9SS type A sorting domain-containing protein [Bacteroidales bacterium]|nr:T9SS type A sorting domain-containing protein [Bacteroidales bacterium]
MLRILTCCLFLIISVEFFSQNYLWVKKIGGSGNVCLYRIVEDNSRNFYVYGYFNGQLKIDGNTINANGTTQDVFLAKFDHNGALKWLKHITGPGTESTYEILLSSNSNFIYISGTFNGNISIDEFPIYNSGGNDIFLIKLNSNGSVTWARNIVYGNNHQLGGYFCMDESENLYVSGTFHDQCTFYPGTITLTYNTSYPNRQNFIAKFDSNGEIVWAKKLESNNINTLSKNITYYNNRIFVVGQGIGNLYYDNNFITQLNSTYRTGFLIALNTNGNFSFVRRIFPNNNELYMMMHTIDEEGNVYLAYKYRSSFFYLDSTATHQTIKKYYNVNPTTYDIGIAKYDFNGTLKNTKTYGSLQDDDVKGIDYSNKRIIVTGSYKAQINFEGYILNNKGLEDAFAAIFNSNLNILNVLNAGGDKIDWGNSAYFSVNARYYIWVGDFASANITFGNFTLTNDNPPILKDGFIAKYGCFDTLYSTVNNVTCPGGSDGSITIIPSEGNEPYSYLWSNGNTSNSITNLTAGNYTVTVSGSHGCQIIKTYSVLQNPPLSSVNINLLSLDKLCTSNIFEGVAEAVPKGGKLPYTYQWSNGQTTNIAIKLRGNTTYHVTVIDACNISRNTSIVMQYSDVPSVIIEKTDITCYGSATGRAKAIPINTVGSGTRIRYRWNNGRTTQEITNLVAGTYSVTITDRDCNNATASATTSILQPNPLTVSAISYPSSPCKNTGIAIALPNYGTPPYTFKWSNAQTNDTIINLASGSYTVTVIDNCGTTKSYTVYVGKKTISITPQVMNCTQQGKCNGNLKVTVHGGDPPYSYLWNTGQTTSQISSVCEGNYSITVTDYNSCTATKTNIYMPICETKKYTSSTEQNSDLIQNENKNELAIKVYPIPTKYFLKIETENNNELEIDTIEVFLYSIEGKLLIKESVIFEKNISIDVSNLNSGIYILKVGLKNNYYNFRVAIF